jgi:hypothetical protein
MTVGQCSAIQNTETDDYRVCDCIGGQKAYLFTLVLILTQGEIDIRCFLQRNLTVA